MTRQERVARYMEILKEEYRGNSSRNWRILDRLSDEELYDEDKITECYRVIDACDARIENNPNRYPEEIMSYVRMRMGLDEYDCSRDGDINDMPPEEVFDVVCDVKGFLGCGSTFRSLIEKIYNIKLNDTVNA